MKYIRTKDGIYLDTDYVSNPRIKIEKEYCLKTADTIGELCDEFVIVSKTTGQCFITKYPKAFITDGFNIFGAIWTDKGLIYVAKMNEKGELELI